MPRATARRPWQAALAVVLACALLSFTAIYRNGSGFQAATAARCHSLSTDHTDARTLFAGDFGPLAVVISAPVFAPAAPVDSFVSPFEIGRAAPERPLSLVTTPFRRPPPPLV